MRKSRGRGWGKTAKKRQGNGLEESFAGRARFFKVLGARRLKNSSVFFLLFSFSPLFFRRIIFFGIR